MTQTSKHQCTHKYTNTLWVQAVNGTAGTHLYLKSLRVLRWRCDSLPRETGEIWRIKLTLFFFYCQQIQENTKTNNILVCLSALLDFPTQSLPLKTHWFILKYYFKTVRQYVKVHFLKRLRDCLKKLSTLAFSKHDSRYKYKSKWLICWGLLYYTIWGLIHIWLNDSKDSFFLLRCIQKLIPQFLFAIIFQFAKALITRLKWQ